MLDYYLPVETPCWGVLGSIYIDFSAIVSGVLKFILLLAFAIDNVFTNDCGALLWKISKTPQRGVSTELSY